MQALQIIYGFHPVWTFIHKWPKRVIELNLSLKDKERFQKLIKGAVEKNLTVNFMNKLQLDHLSRTENHQGVVAMVEGFGEAIEPLLSQCSKILILDRITDPHNLGAIIRTAECLGIQAIFLPKDQSADPAHPTVAKSSSGAIFLLPVIKVTNLVRLIVELKAAGFWIMGSDLQAAKPIKELKKASKLALVVGNEERGVRKLVLANCDERFYIPTLGFTQSLNVSVATGIMLYQILVS